MITGVRTLLICTHYLVHICQLYYVLSLLILRLKQLLFKDQFLLELFLLLGRQIGELKLERGRALVWVPPLHYLRNFLIVLSHNLIKEILDFFRKKLAALELGSH